MSQRKENRGVGLLKYVILIASACVLAGVIILMMIESYPRRGEPTLQLVRSAMQIYEEYSGLDDAPFAIEHLHFELPPRIVNICPRGELIVLGAERGDFHPFNTIDIRELRTGRLINRILAGPFVSKAQLSPCHQYVAVSDGYSGSVRVYGVRSGKLLWTARGVNINTDVLAYAFVGGGRFAVAARGGNIALFDLQTGERLWETARLAVPGKAFGTYALHASEDGQTLLVAQGISGENPFARVLQTSNGKEIRRVTLHKDEVRSPNRILPGDDGRSVFYRRYADRDAPPIVDVLKWDLSSPGADGPETIQVNFSGLETAYPYLTHVTENYLFFTGARDIFVADRITGEILRSFPGESFSDNAHSATPDGSIVAVTTWDSVRIMEAATGRILHQFGAVGQPHGDEMAITLTESGRWVFFPGAYVLRAMNLKNGDVFFGRASSYSRFTARDKGEGAVYLKMFSQVSRIIVGRPADHDFETLLETEREFQCADLSPDGRYLLAASKYDITRMSLDGEEAYRIPADDVKLLSISPNGESFLSFEGRRSLALRNSEDGEILFSLGTMDENVTSVSFNDDGSKVAAADENGTIVIWDLDSGETIGTMTTPYKPIRIRLDGNSVAAIGELSSDVEFRDINTGAIIRRIGGHEGMLRDFVIPPGGEELIAVSNRHNITTWDMRTGERLRVEGLHGHQELTTQAILQSNDREQITFCGTIVFGRAIDHDLNILTPFKDIQSGRLLTARPGYFPAHPFANRDGKYIGVWHISFRNIDWNLWAFSDAIPDGGHNTRHAPLPEVVFPSPDYRSVYILGRNNERFNLPDWGKTGLDEPSDEPRTYALSADGEFVALGWGRTRPAPGWIPGLTGRSPERGDDYYAGSVTEYTFAEDGLSLANEFGNFSAAVRALSYSPNGAYLAVGCHNGKIYVVQRSTGEIVWEIDAHTRYIFAMAFGPEERYLVTKGWDHFHYGETSYGGEQPYGGGSVHGVRVWDLEKKSRVSETWVFNDRMKQQLFVHPSGRYFIGGSTGWGRRVQFRSFPEADLLGTLILFKDLHWVFYTPDGRYDGSEDVEEKLVIPAGVLSQTVNTRRVPDLIDEVLGPR